MFWRFLLGWSLISNRQIYSLFVSRVYMLADEECFEGSCDLHVGCTNRLDKDGISIPQILFAISLTSA